MNIFDNLPSLAKPKTSRLRDELGNYLGTDIEEVEDPIAWWNERRSVYPRLSRMALDYLSVPGKFKLTYFYSTTLINQLNSYVR